MTEMVTSGSMSGEGKRSDGLLGESDHERRRLFQAPPVLHATALLLDSTVTSPNGAELWLSMIVDGDRLVARKSIMAWIFIAVGHTQWIARTATVNRRVEAPVGLAGSPFRS